ncbi:NAD-dependent epimerase/dehydratase family protein [Streptococcus caprae]|uniref:NAD-dependent epimerase/dehydratase family protein n=1 Tax=Streptococcus caprae TaxID=1640501 RepID=A0ABV8CVF5_9STRE
MKVLITGATGFLGGYLVKECLALGYEVIAVGRNQAIGQGLEVSYEKLVFVVADLADKASLAAAFAHQPDKVIHAGALSTVWGPWKDFYEANVLGTQHVIDWCQETGVERLVFVSSPSIYASNENQELVTEEQAPVDNRLNNYIASKIEAEKRVIASLVPYVIIRPRGLFGVGDTSIIPRLLAIHDKVGVPLVAGGQHLIDLTCVENVAYAIGLALEKKEAIGQVYNITNGEPMTFKATLDLFFKEKGIKGRYLSVPKWLLAGTAVVLEGVYRLFHLKGEPRLTCYTYYLLVYSQTLSIEKARRELGYHPIMTIEEGIRHYVQHS